MGQKQPRGGSLPPPPIVIPTNRVARSQLAPAPTSVLGRSRTVVHYPANNVVPGIIPAAGPVIVSPNVQRPLVQSIVGHQIVAIPPPLASAVPSATSIGNQPLRTSEVRMITPATQTRGYMRVDPLKQSTVVLGSSRVSQQHSFVRQTIQSVDSNPPRIVVNAPSSAIIVPKESNIFAGSAYDGQIIGTVPLPSTAPIYQFPTTGGVLIGGSGDPYHSGPPIQSESFGTIMNLAPQIPPPPIRQVFPSRNNSFTPAPYPRSSTIFPQPVPISSYSPTAIVEPRAASILSPQNIQVGPVGAINNSVIAPVQQAALMQSNLRPINSILPNNIWAGGNAPLYQPPPNIVNSNYVPPSQHQLTPVVLSPPSEIKAPRYDMQVSMNHIPESSGLLHNQQRRKYELNMDEPLPSPPVYTFDYDSPLTV